MMQEPRVSQKLFQLFDEWDFSQSVFLWLRLNSECKIKHFKQNRSEWIKTLRSLGSVSLFAYQQWTPGVAGKTGVPTKYNATPSQMRDPTLAESKCSNPACTHLHRCLQDTCQLLSWLLQDCWTTEKIQIHGQGKRKREEASKQGGYT